jgi:Fe-S-cluster containining protein
VSPYEELVAQTDAMATRLSARYDAHLACRAGCSVCCQHHLAVFPVEAMHIGTALAALPIGVRQRLEQQAHRVNEQEALGASVACPMLVDERCSIYESRPLICRTQGLPLLLETADGEQEVDFCPLNFTTPEAVEDLEEQQLVPLDELTLKLALVNLQHCRAHGTPDEESGVRHTISSIILKAEI